MNLNRDINQLNLPELLKSEKGKDIISIQEWETTRRPEIIELFKTHVYGRTPETAYNIKSNLIDEDLTALNGKAVRKQVCITVSGNGRQLDIQLLIYLPISDKPAPLFTKLNFSGNHTAHSDPAILIPEIESKEGKAISDQKRGSKAEAFSVEKIISRGYGLATAVRSDIDPDFDDGFLNGIHPLLDVKPEHSLDDWGTIGAWAWGYSRIMDYIETDKDINHTKVAALGHSRLGKTALWAGALDKRFSIVISNDSGCGGASLSKHIAGETVEMINNTFPHWFCGNFKQYSSNEQALPIDQHMLLALMAPRPVYAASAENDAHADPLGEFISCREAGPVYELYGLKGLKTVEIPDTETPLTENHIGYHIRPGRHGLTAYDWDCYLDFAENHWNDSQYE